jgi:hypothetical protein
MFTPAIKNKIATGKPKEGAKGSWAIIWHTANMEYTGLISFSIRMQL